MTTYTMDQVKDILGCEEETVVKQIDLGQVVGVKIGRRWIFPKEAFDTRLNELALELASQRRAAVAELPKSPIKKPITTAMVIQANEKFVQRRRTPLVLSPLIFVNG